MEVWRLVFDPAYKFAELIVLEQFQRVITDAGKLRVGEICMDGFVTNGVNRNGRLALLRFGDWMMPL